MKLLKKELVFLLFLLILGAVGCDPIKPPNGSNNDPEPTPTSTPLVTPQKRICACDNGVQRDHEYYKGRITYANDLTGKGLGVGENHGTHVIGRLARHTVGELGFGRVFVGRFGYSSWIYKCFVDLTDNGNCKVINYSGGSERRSELTDKGIRYAISKGVRVTTSAGNSYCSYPGRSGIGGLIVVGALDRNGKKIYCKKADAFELGYQVMSTLPGNRYGRLSGTSMASPRCAAKLYNDKECQQL